MKKTALITGLIFWGSILLSSAVFAADVTHTINIVNNSTTALKPTNNPHVAVYNNTTACTAAGGAAVCDTVNLTPNPPAVIPAKSTGAVKMTAPAGCNVSAWQTFWTPNLKGKQGTIRCTKSPINVCNGVAADYTCTISDATVTKVKGNSSVVDADSVQ
ncbi:MAG: hypothetical protein HZB33_05155 [Nitrospirae bacterium]|nr:hypothetical protein [Nitrospirota bacterium]